MVQVDYIDAVNIDGWGAPTSAIQDMLPCSKCGRHGVTREDDHYVCDCGQNRGPLLVVRESSFVTFKFYAGVTEKCTQLHLPGSFGVNDKDYRVGMPITDWDGEYRSNHTIVPRHKLMERLITELSAHVKNLVAPTLPQEYCTWHPLRQKNFKKKWASNCANRKGALLKLIRQRVYFVLKYLDLLPRPEDYLISKVFPAGIAAAANSVALLEEYKTYHPYLEQDVRKYPMAGFVVRKVMGELHAAINRLPKVGDKIDPFADDYDPEESTITKEQYDELRAAHMKYVTWQRVLCSQHVGQLVDKPTRMQRIAMSQQHVRVSHSALSSVISIGAHVSRPPSGRLDYLLAYKLQYKIVGYFYGNPERNAAWCQVWEHATPKTIKKACRMMERLARRKFNLRKNNDVTMALQFITDGVDDPGTTTSLVKLAEMAIRHHQEEAQRAIESRLRGRNPETKTAVPPIPLPEVEGVTFLDTIGKIVEEGVVQCHCVGGYAIDAMNGQYYIFHGERGGETATCQLRYNGQLVQCYGPRNQYTGTARWLEGICVAWGKGLQNQVFTQNGSMPGVVHVNDIDWDDQVPANDDVFALYA